MTPPPSDHFNGKTFFYPGARIAGRFQDFLRWRLSHRPTPWPRRIELTPQPPPPAPRGDEIVATWIGHATWLLQTAQGNFLTDPQFSPCAGPLGRLGPPRVHAPGVAFAALPRIDVVLLSHDHYDHCDLPSLRRLARTHDPVFVAPLRHGDLLLRAGARRIVELDWWQAHARERGAGIAFVPSKHWANRLTTPRNHRLWGGFVLTLGQRRIWFAGDSGYDGDLFREIGRRHGPVDLALIPIGAYEPRWFMAPMHLNPAEAVAAHRDTRARRSLAMHWGTFQLTDEGREEPVQALATARAAAGLAADEFAAIEPGASVVV
ncbi:MAG: MBL fold metallo-hydrolase [Verrucomicrobia bacterium]|nr:MBL fold metallo-hydrolase [Verrucomicrobiota bacterium]